jgi:hypothetical protein
LGDDPNLATTLTTAIGDKADASHTHTLADITDITATTTEINYVDGVTSSIQDQLDSKLSDTPSGTMKLLYSRTFDLDVSTMNNGYTQNLALNGYPFGYSGTVSISTTNPVLITAQMIAEFNAPNQTDDLYKWVVFSSGPGSNGIILGYWQSEEGGSNNFKSETSGGGSLYLPGGITTSSIDFTYFQSTKDLYNFVGKLSYSIFEITP